MVSRALWTHTKNGLMVARQRLACKLVPGWYDMFCELNVLRSSNATLLQRVRELSERSEDRDFLEAFQRLMPEDQYGVDDV